MLCYLRNKLIKRRNNLWQLWKCSPSATKGYWEVGCSIDILESCHCTENLVNIVEIIGMHLHVWRCPLPLSSLLFHLWNFGAKITSFRLNIDWAAENIKGAEKTGIRRSTMILKQVCFSAGDLSLLVDVKQASKDSSTGNTGSEIQQSCKELTMVSPPVVIVSHNSDVESNEAKTNDSVKLKTFDYSKDFSISYLDSFYITWSSYGYRQYFYR